MKYRVSKRDNYTHQFFFVHTTHVCVYVCVHALIENMQLVSLRNQNMHLLHKESNVGEQ